MDNGGGINCGSGGAGHRAGESNLEKGENWN